MVEELCVQRPRGRDELGEFRELLVFTLAGVCDVVWGKVKKDIGRPARWLSGPRGVQPSSSLIHVVKRESKLFSDLHTCAHSCTHSHTRTHVSVKRNFKKKELENIGTDQVTKGLHAEVWVCFLLQVAGDTHQRCMSVQPD